MDKVPRETPYTSVGLLEERPFAVLLDSAAMEQKPQEFAGREALLGHSVEYINQHFSSLHLCGFHFCTDNIANDGGLGFPFRRSRAKLAKRDARSGYAFRIRTVSDALLADEFIRSGPHGFRRGRILALGAEK